MGLWAVALQVKLWYDPDNAWFLLIPVGSWNRTALSAMIQGVRRDWSGNIAMDGEGFERTYWHLL